MQSIDWIIVIAYLIFAFAIGIAVTKKAGKSLVSYFSAGRSIGWWWLGISILATTFAADTPLAITEITANSGIAGNWLWWSWALTYILIAVFFAAKWNKSKVLTDAEFIELRYSGKPAAGLRAFKGFYFGIVINCFILGWVTTAMRQICAPFINWEKILGESSFGLLASYYPNFLLFNGDFNTTLTVLIVFTVVIVYSSLGGIRGVIITDLFQFALAMITAVLFAYFALDHVGGISGLSNGMEQIYGSEKTAQYFQFLPSLSNPMLPIGVFLIYVLVQWWARYDSDGTGYIAQRINTAKTAKDASKGALLFSVLFIALRSWPWIVVALVALVVFPVGAELATDADLGAMVQENRGRAYPALMKMLLPAGLLGLTFASLMAAFMSTVDTHLNWGSSYMVNDIYKRFVNPNATEKRLVLVSRLTVVVISFIAILVSSQLSSIEQAWKYFWNIASGLGVAQLMRWLWWRANVWTEITGMLSALLATIALAIILPDQNPTYQLLYIAIFSFCACLLVTVCTKPTNTKRLQDFVKELQPVGFWKDFDGANNTKKLLDSLLNWFLGICVSYCSLFAIGKAIFQDYLYALILAVIALLSFLFLTKRMNQVEHQ